MSPNLHCTTPNWSPAYPEFVGPRGIPGVQGPVGAQGPAGAPGPQGASGVQGVAGPQGPAGAPGAQGATGAQGIAGPQGPAGAPGVQGASGSQGVSGSQGSAGAPGAQGSQGITGAQGNNGDHAKVYSNIYGSTITVVNDGSAGFGDQPFAITLGAYLSSNPIFPDTPARVRVWVHAANSAGSRNVPWSVGEFDVPANPQAAYAVAIGTLSQMVGATVTSGDVVFTLVVELVSGDGTTLTNTPISGFGARMYYYGTV